MNEVVVVATLRRRLAIAMLLCRYGLEREVFRRIALDLAIPQAVVRRDVAVIFGLREDDTHSADSTQKIESGRCENAGSLSPKIGPQDALPGFLRAEFVKCGKPNCRCRSGGDGLHGPYVRRYFREGGSRRRAYVRKAEIEATRQAVERHRTAALDTGSVERLVRVLSVLSDGFVATRA